ncbi:hypothetical protein PFISCL1PPCAC_26146, partial [Pristionchus fissidentatus]
IYRMTRFNIPVVLTVNFTNGDRYVSELLEKLLSDYNKNVRPVKNASDVLLVKFGAQLCRLIDVDEVNQVLTTSLWLDLQWQDRKLMWNPVEWGGVKKIHVPSDQIWTPDIVLYNNADGEPHITVVSLILVEYTGMVFWMPPSIYKSLCPINIEYFPYDLQECFLKFGGWSNDGQTLDMQQIAPIMEDPILKRTDHQGIEFTYLERGLGLSFFHESAEWDLLNATSARYAQIYPGCCGQQYYIDIRFNITIRRKAIFFTVMLTIPCLLIANTTSFVFVVPPIEHKMTFSISVFVAFSVFYLVLIEIIPPTSLVLPLIGKYLLFTLFMITASIFISCYTINIYRRQAFTAPMRSWQRWLFLKFLPTYLGLQKLEMDEPATESTMTSSDTSEIFAGFTGIVGYQRKPHGAADSKLRLINVENMDEMMCKQHGLDSIHLFRRIQSQLAMISANIYNEQQQSKICDEWKVMARTLDRIFLIIFLILNAAATILMIYNAQSLYDTRPSLT